MPTKGINQAYTQTTYGSPENNRPEARYKPPPIYGGTDGSAVANTPDPNGSMSTYGMIPMDQGGLPRSYPVSNPRGYTPNSALPADGGIGGDGVGGASTYQSPNTQPSTGEKFSTPDGRPMKDDISATAGPAGANIQPVSSSTSGTSNVSGMDEDGQWITVNGKHLLVSNEQHQNLKGSALLEHLRAEHQFAPVHPQHQKESGRVRYHSFIHSLPSDEGHKQDEGGPGSGRRPWAYAHKPRPLNRVGQTPGAGMSSPSPQQPESTGRVVGSRVVDIGGGFQVNVPVRSKSEDIDAIKRWATSGRSSGSRSSGRRHKAWEATWETQLNNSTTYGMPKPTSQQAAGGGQMQGQGMIGHQSPSSDPSSPGVQTQEPQGLPWRPDGKPAFGTVNVDRPQDTTDQDYITYMSGRTVATPRSEIGQMAPGLGAGTSDNPHAGTYPINPSPMQGRGDMPARSQEPKRQVRGDPATVYGVRPQELRRISQGVRLVAAVITDEMLAKYGTPGRSGVYPHQRFAEAHFHLTREGYRPVESTSNNDKQQNYVLYRGPKGTVYIGHINGEINHISSDKSLSKPGVAHTAVDSKWIDQSNVDPRQGQAEVIGPARPGYIGVQPGITGTNTRQNPKCSECGALAGHRLGCPRDIASLGRGMPTDPLQGPQ